MRRWRPWFREVGVRFKGFSDAAFKATIYVPSEVRARVGAIRNKVIAIGNRFTLTRHPGLNAADLWQKMGDDYGELTRLSDELAEVFHRMLA